MEKIITRTKAYVRLQSIKSTRSNVDEFVYNINKALYSGKFTDLEIALVVDKLKEENKKIISSRRARKETSFLLTEKAQDILNIV